MRENQILKVYGTDYKNMTKRLLVKAGLERLIPAKECRIGIKPNLVSPSPASLGATTHPEVVAGIIEYLQERGFQKIVMAEGSWVGDRTEDSVKACGFDGLSETYGVPFLDMQKEGAFEKDCAGMRLNLCNCVKDIDFVINVPVLKGHCQTRVTCALKNMKGMIPNSEKRRFHSLGLHKPIAHLSAGIHQDFIVVDHICGDLVSEDGGNPVTCNCVMAGIDPVRVDAHACRLLEYQVDEVPYIRMAEELGIGSADLVHTEVLVSEDGETWERESGEERKREPKIRNRVIELSDVVEEVESCSACYAYLVPALEQLRMEGMLSRLKEKICIGQGYQGKKGKIGIGRCTAGFEHYVKGCPPTEQQIYEFLKEYLMKGQHESDRN